MPQLRKDAAVSDVLDDPTLHAPASAAGDALLADLLALTTAARRRADEDPFGSPVLSVALALSRRLDSKQIQLSDLETLVRDLRDAAWEGRAKRLAAYVGGTDPAASEAAIEALAASIAEGSFAAFAGLMHRTRFAAVFTGHPTFANPPEVYAALAETASGRPGNRFATHRPTAPTLEEEFTQVVAAITRGRDALDVLTEALLAAARDRWPTQWTRLVPRPVVLASWVGYDTDGRTDIGWWDTLRLRLRMKRLQLARVLNQVAPVDEAISARLQTAIETVEAQIAACPTKADATQTAAFAAQLVGRREAALTRADELTEMFDPAIEASRGPARMALCVARAGLASHGLSLAHTHVRLNSAQIHNAIRLRLGLADPPGDAARRRVLLGAIGAALDSVQPEPATLGALLAEQSSAGKLMLTVAQMVKHIDAGSKVRFLIAETESGYTLLAALWLARLFGIADGIEISPLFETGEALERGARVLEEALRNPHYRAYLRSVGRLSLQFGYSDSGRYIGQLAASYLIERLRMRVVEAMVRHGLTDIEVLLFDTHGESIGRGAHPGSFADRLKYLSPTKSRKAFTNASIALREESAVQGGDGYMLFGTPELALAVVARIANHAFTTSYGPPDPIYEDADFAADFFALIGGAMRDLVEDSGYAALLGAFGPALLDKTGSRPSARQSDSGGPATIRHPRELRAIPNNAILQQLGWCANTLQGLGAAASQHPEAFAELRRTSPRFRRALDLAAHALAHSDLEVLRAMVDVLDPGTWLDRAGHATVPGRREALITVAGALERLDLWAKAQAMFRRVQTDHLALRAAWPDAPVMADREVLLHALRLALIQRIWLLSTAVPDFSPRYGVTLRDMQDRLIRLDVPAVLGLLASVFPKAVDPGSVVADGEMAGPKASASYEMENAEIFEPMRLLFGMVRELGTAITHEVGAFG
jgi:phosphoenolpyruvate carboxylase